MSKAMMTYLALLGAGFVGWQLVKKRRAADLDTLMADASAPGSRVQNEDFDEFIERQGGDESSVFDTDW